MKILITSVISPLPVKGDSELLSKKQKSEFWPNKQTKKGKFWLHLYLNGLK